MGSLRLLLCVPIAVMGCSYDWDGYDPRLGAGGAHASGAGGDVSPVGVGGTDSPVGSGVGGGLGGASTGNGGAGGMAGVGGAGGDGGAPPDPIAGLVGSWPLDEGSGNDVFDATANGFDGTIGTPNWVAGVNGTALRFETSSDTVVIPVDQAFDRVPGDAYTMTAWFKRGSVEFDHSGLVGVKWGSSFNDFYGLEPRFTGGEWRFNFYDGDSHAGEVAVPMMEGVWAHLAAVVDGGTTLRLYFDGSLVSTSTTVDTMQSAQEITFGSFDSNVPTGDLDQVRFYDRALSDAEVVQDMQQ